MTPDAWYEYAARTLEREQQRRPADLMDYMAEEQRRVALLMPFEAALADAFNESTDD